MQIDDPIKQPASADATSKSGRTAQAAQWLAVILATLTVIAVWAVARHMPYGDTDGQQYLAMANGQQQMKPFAFRFLAPATARIYAQITGSSADRGFLLLSLLSEWVLLYGVLSLVLRRRQGVWFAFVLILLPFWLRSLINYQLPDLPHAALCMVYLLLLRRRWWAWAAATLAIMYLTRESTLLVAMIAVPVLWRLAGRRAALLQVAGLAAGVAGSGFASRHALPNHQNMNDTLYMLGKIPWNLSRNIFGVTLWSNTMRIAAPIRVWNVPNWMHFGDIHQVGYTEYFVGYQILTLGAVLTAFGIGLCAVVCLVGSARLRALLPRDQPYLCIAGIYGAAAYLLAPMLGASQTRLLDYGWPLFLVYLPAVMSAVWRNAPRWTVYTLIGLNFIDAWTDLAAKMSGVLYIDELPVLLGCNLLAAWLLLKTASTGSDPIAVD